MKWVDIKAELRQDTGTRKARHLRKKGVIPAILYGRKEPVQMLSVNRKELTEVLHKGGRLLNLSLADRAEKVLVKDVQFDPVNEEILHVDFNRIALDELLTMEVEIVLKGHSKGILAGGIMEQNLHRLTIKCLPTNIPPALEVDVSELDIGSLMRVKDIKLPEGVKSVTEPEVVVCGVHLPKVEEVAPPAEVSATEPEVITARKEVPEEGEDTSSSAKPTTGAKLGKETGKGSEKPPKEEKK